MFAVPTLHPLSPPAGSMLRRQTTAGHVSEMAALLRDRFSPNRLRILGPLADFRPELFGADFGSLKVSTLSYNTEVELEVETTADHLLVTTQLQGSERVHSQGQTRCGQTGFVVVDSTSDLVTKHFSADSHRLNVRVERGVLDALWRRTVAGDGPPPRVFAPFVLDDAVLQRWVAHVQLLLGYVDSPIDTFAGELMMRRIEETLLLHLLLEHPHDRSHLLRRPVPTIADRRIALAEDFIRSHLGEALTLAAIAQAADVSIRSLTAAFRATHETSPMKYIERLRLDAAQAVLRRGGVSVSEVAAEFGFSNLGRFAAAYRRRFGVVPSEARGRVGNRT